MPKLDITSTAFEKGIDLAKEFADRLIGPAIDETGLLFKDKISYWRLVNQVKVLNKAKALTEKNGIDPKAISLKLLVPLLENASLEEDEELQNRWAILLSNMVDSAQNIENHVFPYILSQLSIEEYKALQSTYESKLYRIQSASNQLKEHLSTKDDLIKDYKEQIESLSGVLGKKRIDFDFDESPVELRLELRSLHAQIDALERRIDGFPKLEKTLRDQISDKVEEVQDRDLELHHLSNLVRLGLIRVKLSPTAYIGSHTIRNERDEDYLKLEDVEIEIDVDDERYLMTELGELFVATCNEK